MARAVTVLATCAAAVLVTNCTFGNLADYPVESCDVAATQKLDVCDRLNKGAATTSCMSYQCDALSHRCLLRVRDDDRDGDAPMSCGGTDCDDEDASRSGKAKEICDGVDNDCDGLVDEDVLQAGAERIIAASGPATAGADQIFAPDDAQAVDLIGTYVESGCFPVLSLQAGGGHVLAPGCTLFQNESTFAPREPYPVRFGMGIGAAFIMTSACPDGALSYQLQGGGGWELRCNPASPASLPTVAPLPPMAPFLNHGIVAWYTRSVASATMSDPVGKCATTAPASLAVMRVQLNGLVSPPTDAVLLAAELSASTRRPALLPIDAAKATVLASPLGPDVGAWVLGTLSFSGTGALPAAMHIPGLAGARAVALAARMDGNAVRIAVAAEINCAPEASMRVVLGTLDPTALTISFGPVIELAPASPVATNPSIAWVPARGEWWISWLDEVPRGRLLRVTPDGKVIGGPLSVGTELISAAVSGAGSIFGFDPGAMSGSFVELPVGCAR